MLHICGRSQGRALFISEGGTMFIARGYSIFRSEDHGSSWVLDCRIPSSGWKPTVARLPLGARLLRFNVQALQVLNNGVRVAVARDGIYRAEPAEIMMRRTWTVTRGARPINLSTDGNRLLFGEYGGAELDSVQVRVYSSVDGGCHFDPALELPKGEVRHIHNVLFDRFDNVYWVFAGDHGAKAGIGVLSRDCRHFEWIARGSQMVRVVGAIVRPECLIYGSDSEVEPNHIVRLDKKSGSYERLLSVDGSSLFAADFGSVSIISTCVEPSHINRNGNCGLYGSTDRSNWRCLLSLSKDIWPPTLFQFGLIALPVVQNQKQRYGLYSGQALAGWHDRTAIFRTS